MNVRRGFAPAWCLKKDLRCRVIVRLYRLTAARAEAQLAASARAAGRGAGRLPLAAPIGRAQIRVTARIVRHARTFMTLLPFAEDPLQAGSPLWRDLRGNERYSVRYSDQAG